MGTVRKVVSTAGACALALMFMQAGASAAGVSKDQAECVNTMNKDAAKVAATQGKENTACVKNKGKGKLGAQSADDCLTADAKGKVAKATGKTTADEAKKCSARLPPFGYTAGTTANAAAAERRAGLDRVTSSARRSIPPSPIAPPTRTTASASRRSARTSRRSPRRSSRNI